MTTYRAMWPITDTDYNFAELVADADEELASMTSAEGVVLFGPVHWSIAETDDLPGWRATPTVLVAEAPAERLTIPARARAA